MRERVCQPVEFRTGNQSAGLEWSCDSPEGDNQAERDNRAGVTTRPNATTGPNFTDQTVAPSRCTEHP
jgi:hypothetical protein